MPPPVAIVELLLSGDPDQHAQGIALLQSVPELHAPTRRMIVARLSGLRPLLALAGSPQQARRARGQLGLRAAVRAAASLDDDGQALLRPLLAQIEAVLRGEAPQAALLEAVGALGPAAQRHRRACAIGSAAFDATRHAPARLELAFQGFASIAAEHAAHQAWRAACSALDGSAVPDAQRQRIAALAQRDARASAQRAEEAAQLSDMRQLAAALLDQHLAAP